MIRRPCRPPRGLGMTWLRGFARVPSTVSRPRGGVRRTGEDGTFGLVHPGPSSVSGLGAVRRYPPCMTDIEIGRAKRGRRAYSFDDIAIVPSRRTRDPEEVSTAWQIDAYRFELPIMAAPMDSVMSPATAVEFGRQGGLGVLDLEGLWTRYDDPSDLLAEVAGLEGPRATARLQEIYSE